MTKTPIADLWSLTGGDQEALERLELTGPERIFASPFDVSGLASASVGVASLAAGELLSARGGPTQTVTVDRLHAAAAFAAERLLRIDSKPVEAWADLSGTYESKDGRHILLHCNFPHHAEGVVKRLAVAPERAAVESAVAEWDAIELETALIDDGMIAAAYRTMDEWAAHPHATATAALPALELDRFADADVRPLPKASRPLEGVRVLDVSRVLAGPVAGMTLASHGAEVLRVGAAHLPTVDSGVRTTGFGKRNADIDLRTPAGKTALTRLLGDADVLIDAYRPGALASLGFGPAQLSAIRPGLVIVQLCAFDWTGPWAGRRGFDSIIQATTGLAMEAARATDSDRPVHLPVQALDHATGFLAAHAAMRGLTRRQTEGGTWLTQLSLLRTRNWLTSLGQAPPAPESTPSFEPYLHEVESTFGKLTAVRPVGDLPKSPPKWDRPPTPTGTADPTWL